MVLTDEAIKSVVSDASLASLTAAVNRGKSRSGGGLNVIDLKKILYICDPTITTNSLKRPEIVVIIKKHLESPVKIAPKAVTQQLPPLLSTRNKPTLYKPSVVNTFKPTPEQEEQYLQTLCDHVFSMSEHIYVPPNSEPLNHVGKVLKHTELLRTELLDSLNWDSGFIYRQSEKDMAHSQFMIMGPRDTPYDNGMFHFYMILPPTYPNVPPKVQILNTGGGKYRANPNLYANGKVCLDLLGTWSRPAWKKGSSNLCQVLIAIQGQILNEYPLRNEPGYETSATAEQIDTYNAIIRLYTMKLGMIDMIKNPPIGFEEAVICYFTGPKKYEIAEQMVTWVKAAKTYIPKSSKSYDTSAFCSYGHYQSFISTSNEFAAQIVEKTTTFAHELLVLLGLPEYLDRI